ncbi:hypothetical protein Dda_7279 [Drechslerella dactyloides]|uniref:Uncharacterized protein n=1 Tax=Drechslerella dactyloides TaxID=74499 RepID=A0AAD6IT39_DREDA|nr:hypothetical protein Dda_7279 [Drechslerella dactyloides]
MVSDAGAPVRPTSGPPEPSTHEPQQGSKSPDLGDARERPRRPSCTGYGHCDTACNPRGNPRGVEDEIS